MAEYGTRSLILRVGGTDYSGAVTNARIVSGQRDGTPTFAEAAAGGARKYVLTLTMRQDDAVTALWYYAWAQSGQTVPYEVWPNGRPGTGTPSPTQPRFSGSVVVKEPDGDFIGGEAADDTTKFFETEVQWDCTAKPVRAIS